MSLRESIIRLEQRIRAVARKDPGLGASLGLDLQVIRGYLGSPTAERIATLMLALLEQLEAHERANAPATHTANKNRKRITPEEAAEAVRIHGGVRAAARKLQVSHMTVMRKIRLAHVPLTTSDTSAAAR